MVSRLKQSIPAFGLALLAALSLSALAAGSASALSYSTETGKFPVKFTMAAGATVFKIQDNTLRAGECRGAKGSGQILNSTEGEMSLTLTGCEYGPYPCTSPGQAAGTIVTANLKTKLVYLDKAHTKFGLLITPPGVFGGVVAETGACGTWEGNGLIGQISEPGLNSSYKTYSRLTIEATSRSTQAYEKVEETGTSYHLVQLAYPFGQRGFSLDSSLGFTFAQGVKYLP